MVPWYIGLPLRKAATIPVIGISVAMLGAAYGSYDLTRRFITIPFPSSKTPPKTSFLNPLFSYAGTGILTVLVVTARERFLAPTVPKPPNLPLEDVLLEIRIKNATTIAMHTVINYPYQFRFTSAFVAGATAGITYSFMNYIQNVRTQTNKNTKETNSTSSMIANPPSPRLSSPSSTLKEKINDEKENASLEIHMEEDDTYEEQSFTTHSSSSSSFRTPSSSTSSSSSTPSSSSSSSSSFSNPQRSPQWVMVYDDDYDDHSSYYIAHPNPRLSSSSSSSSPQVRRSTDNRINNNNKDHEEESSVITSYRDNYSHTGTDPYENRTSSSFSTTQELRDGSSYDEYDDK